MAELRMQLKRKAQKVVSAGRASGLARAVLPSGNLPGHAKQVQTALYLKLATWRVGLENVPKHIN